jgi:hypothetical protein
MRYIPGAAMYVMSGTLDAGVTLVCGFHCRCYLSKHRQVVINYVRTDRADGGRFDCLT